jgi:fatty acid desaturase
MIQNFRTDPAYLNKYYAKVSVVLAVVCASILWLRPGAGGSYLLYLPALLLTLVPRFPVIVAGYLYAVGTSLTLERGTFHIGYLALIPLGLYLALIATSYIHNAAHNNIRPRWLRRAIGEACGVFHLVGFPDWTIVHFVHHRHADDSELDPHPPAGLSYWRFLNGVKDSIFRVLTKNYFSNFEHEPRAAHYWRSLPLFAMSAQLLKIHFWFLLFGAQVFTFLFLTSIVAKNLHYAFFNYATHIPSPDDPSQMQIVNLNRSAFFRVVNLLSHGLYFHMNHHDNPNLFNPGLVPSPRTGSVLGHAPSSAD